MTRDELSRRGGCKMVAERGETCAERWPYKPVIWCGSCQARAGITCTNCDTKVAPNAWAEHARTHNPSAYRDGWPCVCRPGNPCGRHADAEWFRA